MKNIIFIISALLILSCNSAKENRTQSKSSDSIVENLLQQNNIRNLTSSNHIKIKTLKGDFASFKLYLQQLDTTRVSSITFALDYINTCIPTTNNSQDSVFFAFEKEYYLILNHLNSIFDSKYGNIQKQYESNLKSQELDAFIANLFCCGMQLNMSEGATYIDLTPDFLYRSFQHRVSGYVKEYLEIRKNEAKEGFSEDAALLISLEATYQRLKKWENYLNRYPKSRYISQVIELKEMYLSTLLTGMDNSVNFDSETQILIPEAKKLYAKISGLKQPTHSDKIISEYYALLQRHGFKNNDSIPIFLEANHIYSMMGVQPFE